jgi:hypothetical protein
MEVRRIRALVTIKYHPRGKVRAIRNAFRGYDAFYFSGSFPKLYIHRYIQSSVSMHCRRLLRSVVTAESFHVAEKSAVRIVAGRRTKREPTELAVRPTNDELERIQWFSELLVREAGSLVCTNDWRS